MDYRQDYKDKKGNEHFTFTQEFIHKLHNFFPRQHIIRDIEKPKFLIDLPIYLSNLLLARLNSKEYTFVLDIITQTWIVGLLAGQDQEHVNAFEKTVGKNIYKAYDKIEKENFYYVAQQIMAEDMLGL